MIIGGGDGGTAREVLRYDSVEKVVMIEQDKIVTEAAKTHFESLASALENSKLDLIFLEAHQFLKQKSTEKFDIIIVDAADTTQEPILDKLFFKKLYDLLDDNGILATQCDAPRWHQERFVSIINSLKEVFLFSENNKTVLPYLSAVASLPTGMWGFACASKNQDFFEKDNSPQQDFYKLDFYEDLFYYNQEIHQAAFCLPNFIKNTLKQNY